MDVFRSPGSEELFLADEGVGFQAGLEGAGLDPDSAAHHVERATASIEAMVGMLNWYRGATPADADAVGHHRSHAVRVARSARSSAHRRPGHGWPRGGPSAVGGHGVPEDAHEVLVGLLLEHLVDAGT